MMSLVRMLCALLLVEASVAHRHGPLRRAPCGKGGAVVVAGDSLASGDGGGYGYRWNATRRGWQSDRPLAEAEWILPLVGCRQSRDSFAFSLDSVAARTLLLACSGSTYWSGWVNGRSRPDTGPAQFGLYTETERINLNAQYDAFEPDVVVINLGPNDLGFANVLAYCVFGVPKSNSQDAGFDGLVTQGAKNWCKEGGQNDRIEELFWTPLRNGSFVENFRAMVSGIRRRGANVSHVPDIIFLNFPDVFPLEPPAEKCLDVWSLDFEQIQYLHTLLRAANDALVEAVGSLPGVSIADIHTPLSKRPFCFGATPPLMYGLSVSQYPGHIRSTAPYHPTREGHRVIASVVKKAIIDATRQ